MVRIERATFFRPDEIAREDIHVLAALFNRCRLLFSRSDYAHVFVPVRTMQLQAVIDAQLCQPEMLACLIHAPG